MKDSGYGKYLQQAEFWAVCMIVHFAQKEKQPDVQYTDLYMAVNNLAGWPGSYKNYDNKVNEKDIWGKDIQTYISK